MFLSKVKNSVDAKGRVSVPSEFRTLVSGSEFDGVIVWPSLDGSYLEGSGIELLMSYQRSLDQMNYYDEGRMALQRAIFAESRKLGFDSTGRVTLPKELLEYANLGDRVTFVGLGRRFEIWNPEAYDLEAQKIRRLARENQGRLVPVDAVALPVGVTQPAGRG